MRELSFAAQRLNADPDLVPILFQALDRDARAKLLICLLDDTMASDVRFEELRDVLRRFYGCVVSTRRSIQLRREFVPVNLVDRFWRRAFNDLGWLHVDLLTPAQLQGLLDFWTMKELERGRPLPQQRLIRAMVTRALQAKQREENDG